MHTIRPPIRVRSRPSQDSTDIRRGPSWIAWPKGLPKPSMRRTRPRTRMPIITCRRPHQKISRRPRTITSMREKRKKKKKKRVRDETYRLIVFSRNTSQVADIHFPFGPICALQELCMARKWPPPTYEFYEEGDKKVFTYTVECTVSAFTVRGERYDLNNNFPNPCSAIIICTPAPFFVVYPMQSRDWSKNWENDKPPRLCTTSWKI